LGEVGIHSRRIGVQQAAGFGVVMREVRFGHAPQPERAHEAVGLERVRAEDFGEAPRPQAPVHLHLPQPVLGVDEAEREVGVLERGGVDVRDTVAVAQHFRRCAQPGEHDFAARHRQRLAQIEVETGRENNENQQNQPKKPQRKPHLPEDNSVTWFSCGSAAILL